MHHLARQVEVVEALLALDGLHREASGIPGGVRLGPALELLRRDLSSRAHLVCGRVDGARTVVPPLSAAPAALAAVLPAAVSVLPAVLLLLSVATAVVLLLLALLLLLRLLAVPALLLLSVPAALSAAAALPAAALSFAVPAVALAVGPVLPGLL